MVYAGSAIDASSNEWNDSVSYTGGARFVPEAWLLDIFRSRSLSSVVHAVCRLIESEMGAASRCAISLIDSEMMRFDEMVAPSLPCSFRESLRGRPVAYEAGPCARAAYLKSQVIVADVELDPAWQVSGFRQLALAHGQRSCWSTPIISGRGEVLGSLAVLNGRPGFPTLLQHYAIARAVRIAAIAIERAQQEAELVRLQGLLVHAQGIGAIATFSWCLETEEIRGSEQLSRIFMINHQVPFTYAQILSQVHPEDLSGFQVQIQRARTECIGITHEFRLRVTGSTTRFVRISAGFSRDAFGRAELLGAVHDITQQYALREARAELAYVARVMSLGVLSASIAHEIKQPLSGIITNASACLRMLASDPPDLAGARDTAKRTLRDGNRAADIITRLRALFTRKTVNGETVDLNEVAREAVSLAQGDLQRRRVSVVAEFSNEVPRVQGDRIQLHQVILNLILNAADAMGGIDDRRRQITISTQADAGTNAVLSVRDNGIGIEAHGDRLFEPFYTTKSDGMGVGLSISHDIIANHGGRLWANSNEGPGATFSFSVPSASRTFRPLGKSARAHCGHSRTIVASAPAASAHL
jgi:signal transduction histidine kinase